MQRSNLVFDGSRSLSFSAAESLQFCQATRLRSFLRRRERDSGWRKRSKRWIGRVSPRESFMSLRILTMNRGTCLRIWREAYTQTSLFLRLRAGKAGRTILAPNRLRSWALFERKNFSQPHVAMA